MTAEDPSCQAPGCRATEADGDADGLSDAVDRCIYEAEDRDGFQDEDGCPDIDDDGDGFLDADDRRRIGALAIDCRDRPEDFDGVEDDDGCPDALPIVDCQIVPSASLRFRKDKAELEPSSAADLDQIVETLKLYPELELEIAGHGDARERDDMAVHPSQRRADQVRRALVERGVDPRRLRSIGYGATRPLASNDTAAGRAQNRRIALVIRGCQSADERDR